LKVGVTLGVMVTVKDTFTAHCPGFGVKVYWVTPRRLVSMPAGFHVPVIPLLDVFINNTVVIGAPSHKLRFV
jgi:hypothetical protein